MPDCLNCEHFRIVREEGGAKARCILSTPPKAGRIITWAQDTYEPIKGLEWMQPSSISFKLHERGEDRIIEQLQKNPRKHKWCPIESEVPQ